LSKFCGLTGLWKAFQILYFSHLRFITILTRLNTDKVIVDVEETVQILSGFYSSILEPYYLEVLMPTSPSRLTASWGGLNKDALQYTKFAVFATDLQYENFQSTVTVKRFFSPIVFVRQIEKCLNLKNERNQLCRSYTWKETSLWQFARLWSWCSVSLLYISYSFNRTSNFISIISLIF